MTAPQTGLKFYEASHRYKLDGRWVPGVTTLLKKALPPTLQYWSARTVAEWVAAHPDITEQMHAMGGPGPLVGFLKELPWQKSSDAAVRGSEVHALAEKLSHGEAVEVPEHLTGYVEACVAFLDEWEIRPVITERPCASRTYWYAGTPDLIADSNRGLRGIWDYKTAAGGIYPETCFQLVAYGKADFYLDEDGAEQSMADLGIEASYGVSIREDGYTVYRLKYDESIFKEWRHLMYVAGVKDRMKTYVTEDTAERITQTGEAA